MKKIFTFIGIIMMLLAMEQGFSQTNVWNGSFNKYWHNANNWSLGHIPTAAEDVWITSAGDQPVTIDFYNETCHQLTVNSGTLVIQNTWDLDVTGSATIYGSLQMANSGLLNIVGNISWESGSSAVVSDNNCLIRVHMNWTYKNGANVYLDHGNVSFSDTGDSYIYSYDADSYFHLLQNNKTGSLYFGNGSTQPMRVNSALSIGSGAFLKSTSAQSIIIKGYVYNSGQIQLGAGTLLLDNAGDMELEVKPGDYYNHFTVSTDGTATLAAAAGAYNLQINGNVNIESGCLYLVGNTMSVKGNWNNQVGTVGFTEGSTRVIFNGVNNHQSCSTETFNILEINKPSGGTFQISGATTVVSCTSYDWTAGAVNVVSGSFTANNLVDDGIYGTFYLNPGGTINLTNNDGYVDLNGSLYIYGGEFNVYGGTATSIWPYAANASVSMSGGTLDFKNRGINIANSSFSITENITGGIIRTPGEFRVYRTGFTPDAGTIELYGPADASISTTTGSNIFNVLVNKGAADGGALLSDKRKPEESADAPLANTVNVASNPLDVKGTVTIQQGVLSCGANAINVGENWTNNVGTAGFLEGTGKVSFNGTAISQYSTSETFNLIEINKSVGSLTVSPGISLTCNKYDWTSGTLTVYGEFTALDLVDNGIFGKINITSYGIVNLTNNDGFVDLNAEITMNTGQMNIYGGTTTSYWANAANASIDLCSSATIDFKNVGIRIPATGYNFSIVSSWSQIYTVGSFSAERPEVDDGEIVMYGTANANVGTTGGSYIFFLNIRKGDSDLHGGLTSTQERDGTPIDNTRAGTVLVTSPILTLSDYLWVTSGTFDVNGKTVELTSGNICNLSLSGVLKMTNPADVVNVRNIYFQTGSTANITTGIINCNRFGVDVDCNAVIGNGNMVNVTSWILCYSTAFEFGNLTLNGVGKKQSPPDKELKGIGLIKVMGDMTVTGTEPWDIKQNIEVVGDLNIDPGARLKLSSDKDLTVHQDLLLGGKLELDHSEAFIHNDFLTTATDSLICNNATLVNDRSLGSGWLTLNGKFKMDSSTVSFPSRNVLIGEQFGGLFAHSSFQLGQSFKAYYPESFKPFYGLTTEFTGNVSGYYVDVTGGNYLPNMLVNKTASLTVYNDLEIKNNLTIQSGVLNSNGKTIKIGGDWNNLVGPGGFVESTGRVIFTDANFKTCYNETFNIMELDCGNINLHVDGNVTCAAYDWTSGAMNVYNGATFTANDLLDNAITGEFYAMTGGTINLINTEPGTYVDLDGILRPYGGVINVYGSRSNWPNGHNAHVEMHEGVIDFKTCGITINNTPTYELTDFIVEGTIRTAHGFIGNRADFTPTGGTFEFYGSSNASISQSNGCTLYNVLINKSPAISLGSDFTITNNLTIQSGQLTSHHHDIFLEGDWNNLVGPAGFNEGTDRVVFTGTKPQYCSTEEFHTLEIDKAADFFYNQSGASIFCQVYDWTQGGMWIQNHGDFFTADLADNYIFGDYGLGTNSTIELHQDALQGIDLCGHMIINGGGFKVYGGSQKSAWGTSGNATLVMTGGVLDFVSQGIEIQDVTPFSFTSGITGGTIRTQKEFSVQSPGFNPVGGLVEIYGDQNCEILSENGGKFYNVTINKPGFATRTSVQTLVVKNDLVIEEGLAEMYFEKVLECQGDIAVNDGGWLAVNSATVKMDNLSSININSGGFLSAEGFEGTSSLFTSNEPSAYYAFNINSGGILTVKRSILENISEMGLNIAPGALVDPIQPFKSCEFRNGKTGAYPLLSIGNDQDLPVQDAVFPANTWGGAYNVSKLNNAGRVTFINATGDFAGAAFENDPFNRIDWFPTLSATATAAPATFCAGSSSQLNVDRIGGLPPFTYQWNPSLGLSDPGIVNPIATPQLTTTYYLTVTDALGTVSTSNILLTVNQLLPVSVTIAASSNPAPPGTLISFAAAPTNGGTAPAYQWKVNVSNVGADQPTYSFNPANGDQVTCVMTSNEVCVSGNPATSNTISMVMIPTDILVTGEIMEGTDTCYNASGTITVPVVPLSTFTVNQGGSAQFIAGNRISFLPGTWVKPGGYMNAYITTTNEYCGNLRASMVTVASGEEELNLFPEQVSQRYSIYPNPTTGNFTLLNKGDYLPGNVQVEIFNMHGEKIYATSYDGERSHLFRLKGLPAGLCFVKVISGERVELFKLIITSMCQH